MKFTKMHGIGNDYVYVNCFKEAVGDPSRTAVYVSDRHFGIGSDGLVLILPSEKADFRMRMFNPDGSEAEMCGNAIRCIGKYVYDNGLTAKTIISVETLAGIKILDMAVKDKKIISVRADMGEPELNPAKIPAKIPVIIPVKIPVKSSKIPEEIQSELKKDVFLSEPVVVGGATYKVTCVSMGNPHAVTYVDDVGKFPLEVVGPLMETHELFPRKINVEFVQIIDRDTLKARVWERGAGETLACGTGACAVLVASVMNGVSERKATVKLTGGDLLIEWREKDNHVYMTGPAEKVFDGEIDIKYQEV